LNDHQSDVFVVCTANDVAKLPPEFARAERFDGTFFLDFPGRKQKQAIWQLWRKSPGEPPNRKKGPTLSKLRRRRHLRDASRLLSV